MNPREAFCSGHLRGAPTADRNTKGSRRTSARYGEVNATVANAPVATWR